MIEGPTPPAATARADRNTQLHAKSLELEAAFLAEMLGHAGLGTASSSFGGGIGEEQFASFLRAEQARAMVEKGGIGLAERLFRAMAEDADVRPGT